MKVKITIYQESADKIIVTDNIFSSILEYSKNFSEILKSDNIVMIEFPKEIIVLKPSKIISFVIEKDLDNEEEYVIDQ